MPIFSAILFFVAGAGTPGPNNTIAMASGAAFGFHRTLPAAVETWESVQPLLG